FGEDDEPGPRLGGLTGERADLVEVLGHRGGRVDLSERELHSGPPEKRALRRRARAHHAVPLQAISIPTAVEPGVSGEELLSRAAASAMSVDPDVDADGRDHEAGTDEEHPAAAGQRIEGSEDHWTDARTGIEEEEEGRGGNGHAIHRHRFDGDGLQTR